MTSNEQEQERERMTSKLFRKTGETYILGAFAGYTAGKIRRLIEENGGSVRAFLTITKGGGGELGECGC